MKRLIVFLLTLSSAVLYGQRLSPIESPFNHLSVSDSLKNYSFIVTGHFYGGRTNKTGYPTNTLLANLDWINQSESDFMVTLGDVFMDVSHDIPQYQASFFGKLKKPMFNSVGNHDLTKDIYQNNFGKTFYYFLINGDIHVVLDTEISHGDIKDEQLALLHEVENIVLATPSIKNVFIYSHRTLWARTYQELDKLFRGNTQSKFGNNFESEVLPILHSISSSSDIYWFSGSLGPAPASFFHFKDKRITYIATAIRGLPRDAVLIVKVDNKGKVSFDTKSFTANKIKAFEDYDLAFWNANVNKKPPFNYRLLPLYTKQMVFHPYFWIGMGIMLLATIAFLYLAKKKKK